MSTNVINFKIPALSEQKIILQEDAYFALFDDVLELKEAFFCDELSDKDGLWKKDVYREFHTFISKESITGITVAMDSTEDVWYMHIYSTGSKLEVYFETSAVCKKIAATIKKWRFNI